MWQYLNREVTVLTGHYGSGKTELAINFAVFSKQINSDVALIDLDIANPYFRSREKTAMLSEKGIELISNAYEYDITADLPAISPKIEKCITNRNCSCVIDAGGNDSGARILNQYNAALKDVNAKILIVVNVYRPETDSIGKIMRMIRSIEIEIGLKIHGIVNNSNLLRATRFKQIVCGMDILASASEITGIPVVANCCERKFYKDLTGCCDNAFPIDLFMRPEWLDF
jgi:MinD-like ATPase involved in chromosome partitioning or flagellar assembly